MVERLSALDASYLYMEEPTTPMHTGGVAVFQSPPPGTKGAFDIDQLVRLVHDRIALVPRYRQKVRWVPGHLAAPVWVDDEAFDVSYHVRRSALPRPGGDQQLHELVARLLSRPLDRQRPLWEVYLVEGLSDRRFAVITKSHQALVDGVVALDLGQVMLDTEAEAVDEPSSDAEWYPQHEPSSLDLLVGAVGEIVQRPTAVVDFVRYGVGDVRRAAERVGSTAGGFFRMARTVARTAPTSPLNTEIGEARRFATASAELDRFRRVRAAHGGTVNDVVLAVIAGALRSWLQMRGEPINGRTSVRAMVPVSVSTPDDSGSSVVSYFVDLPVGEGSPVVRLHQASYAMRAHQETGTAVGARSLAGVAGFGPPTLHAMGARAASGLSRRMFNLVVTNVPGPQVPLFLGGARMLEAYPVVPLAKGQALTIGVTSYDGTVFFGLYGDREAMSDLEVLAESLLDALDELDPAAG
ncbi:MAG: wax ester/triacylglycerol synthase family O-acyltransferase [Actinomycetes bacterium]